VKRLRWSSGPTQHTATASSISIGIRIDGVAQPGHQKQVREYRELNDEGPDLIERLFTAPKLGGVRIPRDGLVA